PTDEIVTSTPRTNPAMMVSGGDHGGPGSEARARPALISRPASTATAVTISANPRGMGMNGGGLPPLTPLPPQRAILIRLAGRLPAESRATITQSILRLRLCARMPALLVAAA